MQIKYERAVYQLLSIYRFLSYALAVMFIQIMPDALGITDLQIYIILGLLGIYTILKVFAPIRWREGSPVTHIILAGDFLICMALVITTNGLNSAFLIYSLTPIMTASLLFSEKVALSLAAVATVSLSVSHIVQSQLGDGLVWDAQGYNLTLLIVYSLFCFVIVALAYRTNINVRRRIEGDAIVEERRRIAREVHDGIAQSLSYLNMKTKQVGNLFSSQNTDQALKELDSIKEVVENTYEDVRDAIDELSTEMRDIQLIPTLTGYIGDFMERTGIQVQFDTSGVLPELSPVAELQLLRIAQEALANVRRHASATEVTIKLVNTTETLEMTIEDNGQGFDPTEYEEHSAGYHGLNIISERAEGLGGNVTISSAPGEGAIVVVSLPIEKARL